MSTTREPDLTDAMVTVIRNVTVDEETARLAEIVISMDACFSARVSSLKKQGVGKERFFQMLEFAEDVVNEAHAIAPAVEQGVGNLEAGAHLRVLQGRMASFDI